VTVIAFLLTMMALIWFGVKIVGPPNQPVGPYQLLM
jgi:hypothetical protein